MTGLAAYHQHFLSIGLNPRKQEQKKQEFGIEFGAGEETEGSGHGTHLHLFLISGADVCDELFFPNAIF